MYNIGNKFDGSACSYKKFPTAIRDGLLKPEELAGRLAIGELRPRSSVAVVTIAKASVRLSLRRPLAMVDPNPSPCVYLASL